MGREQDGLVQPGQAVEDAREAPGLDVRLAVDRGEYVAAGVHAEVGERRRPLARSRRQLEARVVHHVSDDLDPAGDAFAAKRLGAALVRAEEEIGQAVDLDAVVLLRHGEVAAAQSRLDVRDRDALGDGGPRSRERRVRVAEDDDAVGTVRVDLLLETGTHPIDIGRSEVEVDRFGQPELVEEDLRELGIVVLARMDDDLLDAGIPERDRERRRLDELRPVSDNREDAHPSQPREA